MQLLKVEVLKKEHSDRENKKGRIHCCNIRRKLSEQFATAARLYAEAVVVFSSTSLTVSQDEYNRLRKATEEVRGRAEAIGIAFEEHVESHRCGCEAPSQAGSRPPAFLPRLERRRRNPVFPVRPCASMWLPPDVHIAERCKSPRVSRKYWPLYVRGAGEAIG
jgi:hypothetical protein